ncbi:winged helix DNA-binding domain-containing protein [Aeromicrobium terrae]|uniref:winged helix DNA-binding domain-containing protein n=1 Tax=Aeromicrobium terrae TaxID=2498846 RepID=UPI001C9D2310|nr:winged helix DNA-binding domain-containing protein [Aeromicrobium terrae]
MRHITPDERRARLGVRHALAAPAPDVVEAARAVVALHGTDPATTVLSALARTDGASPADMERTLYDDKALVRVLAMRRTVFAVPRENATVVLAGAGDVVARQQRTLLAKMLVESGVTADPEPWIEKAEAAALAVIAEAGEVTGPELAAADPMLGSRVKAGSGKWSAEVSVASRLLTLMSADGSVMRARPRGGWTSTQFRWSTAEAWLGPVERPDTADAAAQLARWWMERYGPATPDDLQWWTGWTKSRTKAALETLDLVEVELDQGPGVVLADDVEPVEAPAWVALLPALDPSSMGWKHRDWLLGEHREQVYDANGNAGPTVWVDGRIVGGWAQRDDGEVVTRVLADVGQEATHAIAARAADLTEMLGEVRLKARARGWTEVEKALRG